MFFCHQNTLDALNSDMFKGTNRTKLEKSCSLLNEKIKKEGSFKALVRHLPNANKFVVEFREQNPEEYDLIVDCLNLINRLCLGMQTGIYDRELINSFLGESFFSTWWASMIIIREKELQYLDDMSKTRRLRTDFGSPFQNLHEWVEDISKKHDLEVVDYALVRLKTGYDHREEVRKIEQTPVS